MIWLRIMTKLDAAVLDSVMPDYVKLHAQKPDSGKLHPNQLHPSQLHSQRLVQAMYEAHHGWLQSWLNKRLSSRDTAADLAQDTFVSVLKHPTDTISAIHEPRAYLTTIAKRILCNYYQRQSLESAYLQALGDLGTAHALSAEDQVILLQTLHDIDQMLGSLPHKTRLAFLLLHLEHMKYAEIASELKVSERTVKRYIASAYEHCLHFML